MKEMTSALHEAAERDGAASGGALLSADPVDVFAVGRHRFTSRLLLGTGKYRDFDETRAAVENQR